MTRQHAPTRSVRRIGGEGGLVAGVDEAGRGPLAGPVVAAAVILADHDIGGLDDSKKLSVRRREELDLEIRRDAPAWSIAWADRGEIDRLNILQATMLAMRRAIIGLRLTPGLVQVDGNRLPDLRFGSMIMSGRAIVGGDARVAEISAASILAKVCRDHMMQRLDAVYPDYGFARHKGYGTAEHRSNIQTLGPCDLHRRSFEPLRSLNYSP